MHSLTAGVHKEEDFYVANCPDVSTKSQGKSIEEAASNLKEATEFYFEDFPLKEASNTFITTFDVAQYAKTQESIRPYSCQDLKAPN